MSELENLKQEVSNLSQEFKEHKGELSSVLNILVNSNDTLVKSNDKISRGFETLTEIVFKQDSQGKEINETQEQIKEHTKFIHELDTQAKLAVQSEQNIKATAEKMEKNMKEAAEKMERDGISRNKEVKKILGSSAVVLVTVMTAIAVALISLIAKAPPGP